MENTGKILHQFTEIHTPVSREEEKCFAAVKAALHINELHVEPVLFNLLLADDKCFLFPDSVLFIRAFVLLCGNAHNRPKRLHNHSVVNHAVGLCTLCNFKPLSRLDNNLVSLLQLQAFRREIVVLAACFEFNSNYFCQFKFLSVSSLRSSLFPAARTPASH